MLANCLTISLIGLVALLSPGPDFFMILRNSFRGPLPGFKTAAGVVSGCLIQISACIFGVSVLLKENETLFRYVKWAGALYLIYLGGKSLFGCWSRRSMPAELPIVEGMGHREGYYRQGLFGNLLNPQFTLFLLSLFAQFTDRDTSLSVRALYGSILWIEGVACWFGLVYLLQSHRIHGVLNRAVRIADPVFGVVLSALGIRIIVG